jgi:hypothetical protein
MRRLLLALALLWGIPALSQTTSVSGTITDSGGQAWANGSVQFTFRPADSNPTGQYFQGGVPFDKNTTVPQNPQPLDGTGSFSALAVPDNATISPSGSTFNVKVCPAATTPCFTKNLTITGATQNISASIIPPAVHLDLSTPLLGARAYVDTEVFGAAPGAQYFNVTDNRIHVCLQTGFPPCTWFVLNGGGGTVSSFSAGNLSPLFTTTVTNPTTTPNLSFTLSNAPAGTIYGNPGGAPAPPSFNTPGSFSGIGTVTNIATTSPISGGPITTTGTISCPTCVTSVSGTANQITSSGGTTPTLSIPATFIAPGSIQATTSLTGTSVTDSGLTSGRCVQAGGGGLLGNAAGACANGTGFTQIQALQITSGICTTANSDAGPCSMGPFSWPSAFADTSYTISCMPTTITGTGSNPGIYHLEWNTKTTTQFSLRMRAGSNSAGGANTTAEIDCIGVHP